MTDKFRVCETEDPSELGEKNGELGNTNVDVCSIISITMLAIRQSMCSMSFNVDHS